MTEITSQVAPEPPKLHPEVADIKWSDAPRIVASGACMGTADLVPGVSGGTMAVALGIYREFLAAITSVNLDSARALLRFRVRELLAIVHWRFIACLGAGILIALVLMGKVVGLPQMITTNPKPVYAVFFGLVLASVFVLARRVGSWSAGPLFALPFGSAAGFVAVQLVPVQTPETAPFVFLCGMIAITAMILPGISGSFMLLVLGKYEFIITAVLSLQLGVAVPFALGCLVGIMVFSRVLGWLLDSFHDIMVSLLTGLLVGSLIRIWPYQHTKTEMIREKLRIVSAQAYWPESFELSTLGLIVFGLVLVIGIESLAARRAET
jgi:putative membrane protein